MIAKNNEKILSKDLSKHGTIIMNHATNFSFYFVQTSADSAQTIDAKYKLKTYTKSFSTSILQYYSNNKVFNNYLFN